MKFVWKEMKGNSMLTKKHIKTFYDRRFLLFELVKKGIKLKYRRSYLGIVWSLLEPIMTTIVLTIVFGVLFDNKSRDYPVYILCGRLLYSFFSTSTKACARSIRANGAMIRKVYVPKYLYPLSTVIYTYFIFLISLLVLIPLMVFCKVPITWHIFQAIFPLVILFVFSLGIGLMLSTITTFFRDVEYLWDVALMLIMYASAIFYYPEKLLKSGFAWILELNPLYCTIKLFRDAIMGNAMDNGLILYSSLFSLGALIVGTWLFYWKQDEFILQI